MANFVAMNPNKRGPVELGLANVGREWVSRGGDFSLFYLEPPPSWYADMMHEAGIRYGVVGLETWHSDVLTTCASISADIVHLHMGRHTMARELRRRGVRTLRTEHSDRPPRAAEPLRRLVRWHRQRPLESLVCVSEFLADQTVRDFLVPRSRTQVIYNGCDLDRFRPRPTERDHLRRSLLDAEPDELLVTVAAHLIPRKQQHLLISAMPEVLRRSPRARLVIAGDGPERENLMTQARALELGDRVTFCFGDNDVALLYAASDVGALVSSAEGLGGSAIEAQACGLPLITTGVDGLAETFLPGQTGLRVDSNAHSAAEAMIQLLTDDDLRITMGERALEFVSDRFNPDRQVESMCRLYDEIGRRAR
ncbi:MAG: glycosyltransferase family 4 protein [Mobilicoccus sp.]|nr:glycosyltransferase family 4 protein [Mobilicoccus sp.]